MANAASVSTERTATAVAVVAALALTTFAVVHGTWAVGGSDSSCYALMADAFARGQRQPVMPLAARAPWPDASLTFAPAGFMPSPVRDHAASPICAPGFSLLMAPFQWIAGRDGIFLVTPIAAALLVLCVFVVGRRLAGASAGALAAALVAVSPIVLFQAVQPMNDIATAALWMAARISSTLNSSVRTSRVTAVRSWKPRRRFRFWRSRRPSSSVMNGGH